MNLLNKKIKDKIKLLDDIDKQYIPQVQSKPKKNEIPFKNETQNIYIDSIENIKNAKNENFDKIYSNFILSGNILGQNLNLNKRNYSISNNNFDKYPTKENTNENENNVGERLNNYGRYIKNKIEKQRQIENNKIKNLTKPKINKTRNQSDRINTGLIPNNKRYIAKSNAKININNKSKNKQNKQNISINSNFTYHPQLNKKSLILAKKLEPSSIRLNKRKKIKEENELKPKMFYVNLYKHNTPRKTSNKKEESKNKTIYDKMNNLYLRGIEQRKKIEKKCKENKQKKEEEYKKFSYKPNVNKGIPYYSTKNKIKKNLSLVINRSKSKKSNSKREYKKFYEKNFQWKKNIEKENIKKKIIKEENAQKLCTFHPKITDNMTHKSNKKYLDKIFEQINEYVIKRRQNIKYKKSEENYKQKKFYINIEGYTPRSTIPKEFEFQTEKRERSIGKNKNRSCENFHVNKNNMIRNSSKKSFEENENHNWFFKEEMSSNGYNSNINESNGTKEAFSHTQFDFIEAVNLLHDKLDKLNI